MKNDSPFIPTELPSGRSAFGKTFAVGAGKYRAFLGTSQIHRLDAQTQQWQEIDGQFVPADNGSALESRGAFLLTSCGSAGEHPFISISDPDQNCISWGMEGACAVAPEAFEDPAAEDEGKDAALAVFMEAQRHAEGAVIYREIFPGVDMTCRSGSRFTEEIVFKLPGSGREIIYCLDTGELKARMKEDGEIAITGSGDEPVYTITPPCLYDASGREGAVHTRLEEAEYGYRLSCEPDRDFMAEADYPVMLDPTVHTSREDSAIVDTHVRSGNPTTNYSTSVNLHASWVGTDIRHSFLKVTSLPALSTNHYILYAEVALFAASQPGSDIAAYAREIMGSWTPTQVTYNNMPAYNTTYAETYALIYGLSTASKRIHFDITALAKKWYRGSNNGVAFTSPGTQQGYRASFYSTETGTANCRPYFEIQYASLAGLEDYFTYQSVSSGRAGSGQVSLNNGNMIFLHSDTGMNGARMPVSVTHVYNSCDADTNPFYCGYGWRTNYHQTLHKEYLDSTVYYVYTDGDGTEHWFKPANTSATKYRDESGLSMELVPGDPTTIRDKGDNLLSFPQITATPTASNPVTSKVLVTRITDACGNAAVITASGMKITKITDGAGRVTNLAYSNNLLSSVRTPWQTTSNCVRFTYSSSRLTGVTYEDNRTSSFTYLTDSVTSHRLLTAATGPEGIKAAFTYANTNATGGLPHIVTETEETGGTGSDLLTASHTSYDYGANLCLVTDLITGKALRYHFNDNGNVTGVDDGLGYAVFTEYDRSGANADAPINHATRTSRIQQVVNNLLKDGLLCKTSGSSWTKYGTGTVEQIYNGSGFGRYQRKFTVANGNTLYLRQTVSVTAGKTYTLSGYAQSLGPQAYLRVTAGSSTFQSVPVELTGTQTQTALERTRVTFTVPSGVSSITCDLMAKGTSGGTVAWWDSAQLEEGQTANHVNLLENSKMTRTGSSGLPDCWSTDSSCSAYVSWQSRGSCTTAMPGCIPGDTVRVDGLYSRTVRVYQSMNVKGQSGDKLTVGGWCSSYAKKTDVDGSVFCRIQLWFSTTNDSSWSGWRYGGAVDFNHGEGSWQFASGEVTAPMDYFWVRATIYFNRQMNFANFSNLFVYKETYGTDYEYDANGNRKRSTAPSGISGRATYDGYNNVLTSFAPGRTVSTAYTWGSSEADKRKHLLRTVTTPLGTKTSYLYSSHGNPTQAKTEDSTGSLTKFIQTNTTYTSAGTYASTQTDARGNVVTTVTDANRGTVTSVTDPKNQVVSNVYDALRRLTKTSTMLTDTEEVKSENTYNAATGYLTSVKHNTTTAASGDVTYNFTYDVLGRQKKVSVGSSTLSTTYYNATHRTVDRVAFSNGGIVKYVYDGYGRVTGIRYDGATSNRFSYAYDAQGRIGYVKDNTRNTTVYTDYDLAGRPCRKTHLAGTAHAYTGELAYNAYELPGTFTEQVGTARTRYTTGFSYNNENRVTTLTYGTGSVGYTYDKLGRITKRALKPASTAVNTSYTYLAGGQGTDSTTELIQKITQGGVTLTYSYDACGNITQVSTGSLVTKYGYDKIGRLTRVNDQTDLTADPTGTTWVYTYDLGGNILTRKAYVYTTGSVSGLTPVQSHSYTYGNAGWKDQLTQYDGAAVSYDSTGNPTGDGTWTYTWEHGKQLRQMSKTGETLSFEYNEDGLRVKKTATSTGTTAYTLHGKNIVHMTQGSHVLHFYYDAQGKPAVVIYDGTAYGYLYNLQGDVVALVNGAGTKVVEYTYDAWGVQLTRTGTMANSLGKIQPFRYRGYVYDEESGLYYLRSRYYRPAWGRFISADALVKGNLYCYCNDIPVSYFDNNGNDERYVTYEINNNSYFRLIILPRIMEYLKDPKDYRYDSGLYRQAYYSSDGVLISKGWTDCSHLMYEITGHIGSYTAPYRYDEVDESQKGRLFDSNGDLCVELVEGMEVYNRSTGHVGMLMLYDFGNGLEWAVFQSTSDIVTRSEVLFENDSNRGPNITSFYKNKRNKKTGKLETNWYYYTMPRYNEEN